VHLISLIEQKLHEIGSILTRCACDKRFFHCLLRSKSHALCKARAPQAPDEYPYLSGKFSTL
jgi:hypothetical protein